MIANSGRNAGTGKTGKVLQVDRTRGRALVEGMNLVKRHMRKTQDTPQGGIVEKEAPIDLSNLMVYCPHDKKGVRTGYAVEGGRKVRKCKVCGHAFDA